MPSTRSQAGADAPAGEAAEVAEALEEAAAESCRWILPAVSSAFVSVLSIDSQSSAARLGGEVSLSFSRFCSFFGSLSRRTFSHPEGCAHPRCGRRMPSTRSQAGVDIIGGVGVGFVARS